MRVFVTGASGFVGSAIVKELIDAGHKVLGLARSDKAAASVAALGAEVHRGDMDDLDSLRRGAAAVDGVIHTAFNHDFSKFKENCENDRQAIEALGTALEGSDRPLLVTSGVALLASGRAATEDDAPEPHFPRASEAAAIALAEARRAGLDGPSAAVDPRPWRSRLRADPDRHCARERRVGLCRRWTTIAGRPRTAFDAARVYRLALERGATVGPFHAGPFHAVAEEGIPFKEIAAVIGRRLNLPIVAKTKEEAADHFGWFAMFAGMDLPASSVRTRKFLGWEPKQPGLLADIDHPSYFAR